jgi:tetratricopeptide (TPR) repeat protein
LGYICRRQADNKQARIYFERAVLHARNAGAPSEEAETLAQLCVTLRELGDFAGAEQRGQEALAVAQSAGNDYLAANILHRLSITSYYHNELKVALERSEQAAALQRQMGDAGGIVLCDSLQALVSTTIGALDEAAVAIERARHESNLLDNSWLQGLVLYVYGIVNTLNGNLKDAEEALRLALTQGDYVKDLPMREGVLLFLGINAVAQGNLEEAQRIEAMLAGNVAVESELLGGLFRGMAAIARGNLEMARAIAISIRQRAQESGYLVYAYEADRLLMAGGNPPPVEQLPGFICLHLSVNEQSR